MNCPHCKTRRLRGSHINPPKGADWESHYCPGCGTIIIQKERAGQSFKVNDPSPVEIKEQPEASLPDPLD
jgi:DNA-directed RNA polymerase subunit RPC12/RpoP